MSGRRGLAQYTDEIERRLSLLPDEVKRQEIAEIDYHLNASVAGRQLLGESETEATQAVIQQFGRPRNVAGRIARIWLRGRLIEWCNTLPGTTALALGALTLRIDAPGNYVHDTLTTTFHALLGPHVPIGLPFERTLGPHSSFRGLIDLLSVALGALIGAVVARIAPRWSAAAFLLATVIQWYFIVLTMWLYMASVPVFLNDWAYEHYWAYENTLLAEWLLPPAIAATLSALATTMAIQRRQRQLSRTA